jgi:hypothetical protein
MAKKKPTKKTVNITNVEGMLKDYMTIRVDALLVWSVVESKKLNEWCMENVGFMSFEDAAKTITERLILDPYHAHVPRS